MSSSSLTLHDEDFSETASEDNYEIISQRSGYTDDEEQDDDEEEMIEEIGQSGVVTPAESESEDVGEPVDVRPLLEARRKMMGTETEEEEEEEEKQIDSMETIVPSIVESESESGPDDSESEEEDQEDEDVDTIIHFSEDKVDQGVILGEYSNKCNIWTDEQGSYKATLKMPMDEGKLYLARPYRVLYLGPKEHREDVVQKLAQALALSDTTRPQHSQTAQDDHLSYGIFQVSTDELSHDPLVELIPASNIKLEVQCCDNYNYVTTNKPGHINVWRVNNNDTSSPCEPGEVDHTTYIKPDLAIVLHEANAGHGNRRWHFKTGNLIATGVAVIELWVDKNGQFNHDNSCISGGLHVYSETLGESPDSIEHKSTAGLNVATFLNIDASQLNRHLAYLCSQHVRRSVMADEPSKVVQILHELKSNVTTVIKTACTRLQSTCQTAADHARQWHSSGSNFIITATRDPRTRSRLARLWLVVSTLAMTLFCMSAVKYFATPTVGMQSMNTSVPLSVGEPISILPAVTMSTTVDMPEVVKIVQPSTTAYAIEKYVTDIVAAWKNDKVDLIEHPLVKLRKHKDRACRKGKKDVGEKVVTSKSSQMWKDGDVVIQRLRHELKSSKKLPDLETRSLEACECLKNVKQGLPCRVDTREPLSRNAVKDFFDSKLPWLSQRLPTWRSEADSCECPPLGEKCSCHIDLPQKDSSKRLSSLTKSVNEHLRYLKSLTDQTHLKAKSTAESLYTRAATRFNGLHHDAKSGTAEKQKAAGVAVKKASSQAKALSSQAQAFTSKAQGLMSHYLDDMKRSMRGKPVEPAIVTYTYSDDPGEPEETLSRQKRKGLRPVIEAAGRIGGWMRRR